MITKEVRVCSHKSRLWGDVTVGCDPEFLLVDGRGELRRATEVLHEIPGIGPAAALPKLPVGCDGNAAMGSQAEVRPQPSPSPVRVVANLVELLNTDKVAEVYQNYHWWVGSGMRESTCGGHIHIGGMNRATGMFTDEWMERMHAEQYATILELFDEMLLPWGILLSSEDSAFCTRRNLKDGHEVGYGSLRGMRWKPYGMEYRTLPCWMYSPEVALFFLATAKALVMEVITDNLDYDKLGERETLSNMIFNRASLATLKRRMGRRMSLLSQDIRDLSYYRTRPELLVGLEEMERLINGGVTWDRVDVQQNWLGYDVERLPRCEPSPLPALQVWIRRAGGRLNVPASVLDGERHIIYEPRA